jgi:histone H3/H4
LAAALAWLVGPGLKRTLETATTSEIAIATVRRLLKEWVPEREKVDLFIW